MWLKVAPECKQLHILWHNRRITRSESIYLLTLPLADTMYLPTVEGDYSDIRFSESDKSNWRVTRKDDHPEYESRVYERISHRSRDHA